MKRKKLMFVLPNLLTLASILCGVYAMMLCASGDAPAQFKRPALVLLFAMLCDGLDGRVARLTGTQSDFGAQLDSLADVVSFGAAPALLVYRWALAPLGMAGLLAAFAFAACGAIRLARFNVLAQRAPHTGASRFFVGLPIPLAAGMLLSVVLAYQGALVGPVARWLIVALVVLLALLMVSTLRYRTFKDLRLSRRSAAVFLVMGVGGVLVATRFHPAYPLAAGLLAYLASGLLGGRPVPRVGTA